MCQLYIHIHWQSCCHLIIQPFHCYVIKQQATIYTNYHNIILCIIYSVYQNITLTHHSQLNTVHVCVCGLDNLLLWFMFTILCFCEFSLANSTTHNKQHHHHYNK